MKPVLPFLFLFLMTACTAAMITEGDSFTDPGWNGISTNSVLVEVQNVRLAEQKAIETSVVSLLKKSGLRAEPAYSFFPPTRIFTPAQRQERLRESGYESYLVIRPYNHEMITHYEPPATRPFGNVNYGSGGWGGVGVGISFDRGYRYDEPVIHYQTDLYLVQGNRNIWTGDYATRGVDGMSYETLGDRFGKELVEKLKKDGLI